MIRKLVTAVVLSSVTVGWIGTGVGVADPPPREPATGSASCIFNMVVVPLEPVSADGTQTVDARIKITAFCHQGLGENSSGVNHAAMKSGQPGKVEVTGNCSAISAPSFQVKAKWLHPDLRLQKSRIKFAARTFDLSGSPGEPWTTTSISNWTDWQLPGSFAGGTGMVTDLMAHDSSCGNGSTQPLAFSGRLRIDS